MKTSKRFTLITTTTAALLGAALPGALAARTPTATQLMESTLLRHGAVEMRLSTTPVPRLTGPGTDLAFHDDVLPGFDVLSGVVADGRYDVRIQDGHAEGSGPRGKVSLDLIERGHALQMKGIWNGERVDLTFTDQGISGRMVHHLNGGARAVESCRVAVDEHKGPLVMGEVKCLGHGVPLAYTIRPAPLLHLHRPQVALLLLTYFTAAPSAPPVA
jgi:hypothetical protein